MVQIDVLILKDPTKELKDFAQNRSYTHHHHHHSNNTVGQTVRKEIFTTIT